MKHLRWPAPLLALAAVAPPCAEAARVVASQKPDNLDQIALAKWQFDFAACNETATEFLGESPVTAAAAIEKAVDFCAVDRRTLDNNYACAEFKDGIAKALDLQPPGKLFGAEAFCQATEQYMLEIRGAARVPRTGSGTLLDFKVSPHCAEAVAAAFAPAQTLSSESVPDFWWAMCMNQDCAHFLPSRTRWCNVQRQPTHSAMVCEAARNFALDEVTSGAVADTLGPLEICDLYAKFVRAAGAGVDAYEHVMHNDTVKKVPVPEDQARFLLSSQLVNDAKAHYIRDHMAQPIERGPVVAEGGPAAARSGGRARAEPRAIGPAVAVLLALLGPRVAPGGD